MNINDKCELKQSIVLDKETKFSFWYYMYGRFVGTLELKAGDKTVWSMTGQQEPEWFQAKIYLPSGSYEVYIYFFLFTFIQSHSGLVIVSKFKMLINFNMFQESCLRILNQIFS